MTKSIMIKAGLSALALGAAMQGAASADEIVYRGLVDDGARVQRLSQPKNLSEFTALGENWTNRGLRLVDIETGKAGGKRFYVGLWEKGSGGNLFSAPMSKQAFDAKRDEHSAQGLRLVDFEIIETNNGRKYLGVWRPGTGQEIISRPRKLQAFLTYAQQKVQDGFRATDLEVIKTDDGIKYTALWRPGSGTNLFTHAMDWDSFKQKREEMRAQNGEAFDIERVMIGGAARFTALWRAGDGDSGFSRNRTIEDFQKFVAERDDAGKHIVDFELFKGGVGSSAPAASTGVRTNPVPADVVKLKDALDEAYKKAGFVGYAFSIAKDGKVKASGVDGWARRPNDGNLLMSSTTRTNVASVSKAITAIAVLQLLEANGLSIEEPIAPYLPAGWARGRGFKNAKSLTFRQLLTHTSGLDQKFQELKAQNANEPWGNDWDGLKFVVETGVDQKYLSANKYSSGNYAYKNANYALFRVMIPILWRKSQGAPASSVTKQNHGPLYMLYVGEHIFQKAGVQAASCTEPANIKHAYAYKIESPNEAGSVFNGKDATCGAHAGWRLSSKALATISSLANCSPKNNVPASKRLLSQAMCAARDQYKLGWNRNSNKTDLRRQGRFWHGGDLFSRKSRPRKAIHTCMMKLPGGLDVGAIVNSDPKNSGDVCSIILDAHHQL